MVVTRLRSLLRVAAGRLPVENPGREEASKAPSTAFPLEALTRRGAPPRPTFRLWALGMVTPEAPAKWRGPARPNAASASKKVSAVEPSEADAMLILCKREEAIFVNVLRLAFVWKKASGKILSNSTYVSGSRHIPSGVRAAQSKRSPSELWPHVM